MGEFYLKNPTSNNFDLVDNDFSLLKLIEDLGDDNFLDLYVEHVVDKLEVVKDKVPTGYLCGSTISESVNKDGVKNSNNINVDEGDQQRAAQFENINIEVGVDEEVHNKIPNMRILMLKLVYMMHQILKVLKLIGIVVMIHKSMLFQIKMTQRLMKS